MNRLLNIFRTKEEGGFPWSADTASVFNENIKFLEVLFDSFQLPRQSAILLSGPVHVISYMFVNDYRSWSEGTILLVKSNFKITDPNLPRNINTQPGKYSLKKIETVKSIYREDGAGVYEDCIKIEEREIVLADESNPGYNFYYLSDLLGQTGFLDKTAMITSLPAGTTIQEGGIYVDRTRTHLKIDLQLSHASSLSGRQKIIIDWYALLDAGYPPYKVIPLNAVYGDLSILNIKSTTVFINSDHNNDVGIMFDTHVSPGDVTIITGDVFLPQSWKILY